MFQLLKKSILSGDCSPCFDALEDSIRKNDTEGLIRDGPEIIKLVRSAGLFHFESAFNHYFPQFKSGNKDSEEIEPERLRPNLKPIKLPVLKHFYSEVIFPEQEDTFDLLRNDQRLSELYKETTDEFLKSPDTAGDVVTRCANLLESTFHKHIQELCKCKDLIQETLDNLQELLVPIVKIVSDTESQRFNYEWDNFRARRLETAKVELTKGISFAQHQLSQTYNDEQTVKEQYYELLYRDKIIRYQSTQLTNTSSRSGNEYSKLLKYLSSVVNIAPSVIDEQLLNIFDALENEDNIDFAIARDILQNITAPKPSFTRKDSVLQSQSTFDFK
eukprot:NODE_39_length_35218_cov_0.479655.p10 type:complete len:331 gc:universal NODE_39_length_35218_cov_0.479655:17160-16168(-)